jgi:hypothetical protein
VPVAWYRLERMCDSEVRRGRGEEDRSEVGDVDVTGEMEGCNSGVAQEKDVIGGDGGIAVAGRGDVVEAETEMGMAIPESEDMCTLLR